MPRIVFNGAGSVEFTQNILADLLTTPELAASEIVLHDIDPERLETARAMAVFMADKLGLTARVAAHLERARALEGADYVINAIAVGGYEATRIDFEVPKRFGIRQTIADTLGIGGIFRALRTVPVMVSLGNEMAAECPDALLLNYTNPMSMIPWSVYAGSRFTRVVGLCHSVRDTQERLAGLVGVPVAEAAFVTAGVNHQAFVLRFEHRGENLYERLDRVIEQDPELQRTVRVEIYRRFGYFPTESSEHGAEYVPWFLPHQQEVDHYRIPIDVYLSMCEENLETSRETTARLRSGEAISIEPSSELASEVIYAMETGEARLLHGNVRNGGLITNLPAEGCVEVPCLVDRAGVQPTRIGELPPQLAALNRNFLNVSELTLAAALEGRRDHVYHAAMLDPSTAASLGLRDIHALVDAMIDAHRDRLPEGIVRGAKKAPPSSR